MRSKIDTQSRLAAHIVALFLLILMLVYLAPPQAAVDARRFVAHAAAPAGPAAPAPIAGPSKPGAGPVDAVPVPSASSILSSPAPLVARPEREGLGTVEKAGVLRPHGLPLRPPTASALEQPAASPESVAEPVEPAAPVEPAETVAEPDDQPVVPEAPAAPGPETQETPGTADAQPTATADVEDGDAPPAESFVAEEIEQPGTASSEPDSAAPESPPETTEPLELAEGTDGKVGAPAEAPPAEPRPSETEAPVAAPSEGGSEQRVVAPLKNANLEVLGDGFYWLSHKHDLEKELAAIPEIAGLIILAPLPGYRAAGFDHVKTEVIPSDPADLTADAADRFIHLATGGRGPVVAAALPGARGAAFFKGAYLIRNRGLDGDAALREVEAELEEAGNARGEVVHRLLRLAGGAD